MSNKDFEIDIDYVIDRLRNGDAVKVIAKDMLIGESKLHKEITKFGYVYDKKAKLWYHKDNKLSKYAIDTIKNCDIEEKIEIIAESRYYFKDGYFYDDKGYSELSIYEGIYKELEELAGEYCCDSTEELIEYILLNFLDCVRPRNREKEFKKRRLKENGYDEYEIKFIIDHGADEESDIDILWTTYLKRKGYTEEQLTYLDKNNITYKHYELISNNVCENFELADTHLKSLMEEYLKRAGYSYEKINLINKDYKLLEDHYVSIKDGTHKDFESVTKYLQELKENENEEDMKDIAFSDGVIIKKEKKYEEYLRNSAAEIADQML